MSTDEPIIFAAPKIGPKVYLACGPSGWSQPFPRAAADKALAAFVQPLAVATLVEMYNDTRQLTQTPSDWYTITGFLARTMQTHPSSVPAEVGIAFWAHSILGLLDRGRGAN